MGRYFTLAGLVAAILILVVGSQFIGVGSRFPLALLALANFGLSAFFLLSPAASIVGAKRDEMQNLAFAGPASILFIGYFLLAGLAFILCVNGEPNPFRIATLAISMMLPLVALILLRGAADYLQTRVGAPATGAQRAQVVAVIDAILREAPANRRQAIQSLREDVLYSPSDIAGLSSQENADLVTLANGQLKTALKAEDDPKFESALQSMRMLLDQRAQKLIAQRSKA